MAQKALQGSRINSAICQDEASGVTQLMRMDREWHLGRNARPSNHFGQASSREGCVSLADKHKRRFGLTLQRPQGSQFIAQQGVCACYTSLGPPEVQMAGLEFNVTPLETTDLRGSQAMPEGDEKHRTVALAMAIGFSGIDELRYLPFG
jgi:hypothetical protein